MLNLEQAKQILADFKPYLSSKYPIATLGLFGSIVRDDFTSESDVDIIVEFNGPIGAEFILLGDELEDKFQRRVDLVSRRAIKPRYWERIEPHVIYV